jgi:serine protease Do
MNVGKMKSLFTRRMAIPAIVAGALVTAGAWTFARTAIAAAPAAAPLDESSVSALLSLDQAMETLAARVTPAVVNVTVTSKVRQPRVMMFDGSGQDGDQEQDQNPNQQQEQM